VACERVRKAREVVSVDVGEEEELGVGSGSRADWRKEQPWRFRWDGGRGEAIDADLGEFDEMAICSSARASLVALTV
jgi:hypothetical protein